MVTLVNRAKMTTSTTGTGTITLGSAVSGFQTFADAGVSNGQTVRYTIEDGTNFEIGSGTYTASGTTLSRNVSESSNSDAAINLSGSAEVFVTAAAADILSAVVDDTTPQLGGDLDVGTHRIETTESNMNFEVDSDASSTGYEGYYFYGGPTTNGYNRIWITGTETALQQRVGTSTAYSAFIQNNNQYSIIINEHGGNHPAKITNWGNGSSAHLNIGVRHADAKVRFTDHTGNTLRYAFPNSTPSSGQVLTASDGSGTLSWATASGSDPDLYRDNASSATTPSATGTNAVAIGTDSVSSGTSSMAIGQNTNAANTRAVVLGGYSQAYGINSAAIGFSSTVNSNATDSSALGTRAQVGSNATGATAIGKSYASGNYSFAAAIENNGSSYGSTGTNSVAIGKSAKAQGTESTALGPTTQAQNSYSVAIGYQANSSNDYGVAIGRQAAASGATSTVLGGYACTASGSYSTSVGGRSNVADGYGSRTGGYGASAGGIRGKDAFASQRFSTSGDAQTATIVLKSDTTDATAEALTTNNSTASTDNQVVLPNNSAYFFSGTCIAREQAADGTDVGAWEFKGAIRREANAGTTTLIKSTIDEFNVPTGWALALSADTTNGCLKVQVTGAASTDIRWVATVHTSEVTYA